MSQFLYVARGSAGVLKVGCTRNPKARRVDLRLAFRKLGQELIHFEATAPMWRAFTVERELIRCLHARGLVVVRGREFFSGGDFDAVAQLTHSLALRTIKAQAAIINVRGLS